MLGAVEVVERHAAVTRPQCAVTCYCALPAARQLQSLTPCHCALTLRLMPFTAVLRLPHHADPAAACCAVLLRRETVATQVIFALPAVGETDFTMRIFNSDGSEPEMCGNGIRCLARFVADVDGQSAGKYKIHTLAGGWGLWFRCAFGLHWYGPWQGVEQMQGTDRQQKQIQARHMLRSLAVGPLM